MGHCAGTVEGAPHIVEPAVVLGSGYEGVVGAGAGESRRELLRENKKESVRQ